MGHSSCGWTPPACLSCPHCWRLLSVDIQGYPLRYCFGACPVPLTRSSHEHRSHSSCSSLGTGGNSPACGLPALTSGQHSPAADTGQAQVPVTQRPSGTKAPKLGVVQWNQELVAFLLDSKLDSYLMVLLDSKQCSHFGGCVGVRRSIVATRFRHAHMAVHSRINE